MSEMQRASSVKSIFFILLTITKLTAGAPNTPPGPKAPICQDYADIAFVVDMSGSIEGDGKNPGAFDLVKRFLKSIVQELPIAPDKMQVGLVTFGNQGRMESALVSNSDDIIKKIDGIVYNTYGENTNTSGGINVMRTQLLSPKSPNYRSDAAHIAIVVTDGLSTRDPEKTIPSANEAKKEGIIMLSIGVTNLTNLPELKGIASPLNDYEFKGLQVAFSHGVFTSKGYVSYVPDFKDLILVVKQLASQIISAACPKSSEVVNCKV